MIELNTKWLLIVAGSGFLLIALLGIVVSV